MTKRLGLALCFAIAQCVSVVGQTDIVLSAVNLPKYPPLARQARVEGSVTLTFTLPGHGGQPINVKIVSGHPLLKETAVENIKTWMFENPSAVDRNYATTFEFRLSAQEVVGRARTSVTFDSYQHVVVLSDPLAPTVQE